MTGSNVSGKLIKLTKDNYKGFVRRWSRGVDTDYHLVYCPDDQHDYYIYNKIFKFAFELGILVQFENIPGGPYGEIMFLCTLDIVADDEEYEHKDLMK